VTDTRTPREVAAEMALVRHEIDMLELCFSSLAARFAASEVYEEDGSATPIDWMRHHCNLTHGAAADRLKVGQVMERMPESMQALARGEIGFAHVASMARTADAVGDRFQEDDLVKQASENSPGKFHHVCRHYRHSADPAGFESEQAVAVENRYLELSTWIDGSTILSGALDPVGGAALRNALEPLARKSGEHDHRDYGQRMADALVDLASGAGNNVQMQVTASVETLLGLIGAPAAEMEHSQLLSSKSTERIACECNIARVLLDAESVVIDVGRSKRVVSTRMRRALEARDRGCRWPRCDRPAKWSAAHHVVHWIHGGSTDLDNLVLLCHRHHRMVHEGKWQLVRGDDGEMLAIPPYIRFGATARGPD
ncbi:MAG TPA: DUF222 domain-containing protein, partial [Candidatus Dormibacteraeota bacterium]|nr:DUF222 domain-containing protein [Candidatus Dormibacteraeota bacterium]